MMHEGEIVATMEQVRRLVASQFPHWAGLPIRAVPASGTDHALFRLGEHLVARLPRIDEALDQVDTDRHWLPLLAPHLPLAIPSPVAVGQPGDGYPWRWLVVPWLVGENPAADNLDLDIAAHQLAGFVTALHAADTTGGPAKAGTTRGAPLAARDEITRAAIAELGDRVDAGRVKAAWDDAVAAPAWTGSPVWIHGDLQPGNLLAHEGRLTAVIDFGGLGLGDPAVDLMPAWNLFDARSRVTFRGALGYDDSTWRRGRGWALSTALIALPYYWDRAPAIADDSRRRIDAVLDDLS